ncbi:peptidase S28 [Annulohypoxylon maeteangense]|uniref:peptidase S28 n=1 Tax=Annulohypoxylon maeteangense TaxID=1927788 RepID=UPI0020076603|nr:peptidase S28 [Annulohypoxylon maeteangense]KAI0884205.1 peptidase S28 [Annulohypoxylon maeteangense]
MVRYGIITGLLSLISAVQAIQKHPLPISELKKQIQTKDALGISARQADLQALYPEYNLSTPIDHFHNDSTYEPHSDDTFNLRYWFDAQYYKPGGPVIVLSGGETSGSDRLPFLQKGIVYQLAKATNGLGVILEHRYYGKSIPVPDFSTENLRFLTTDQALADTAYFAKNVKFEGLEDVDLNPETTPWIAYGGSYAGAFVAFLRVLYPDVYYGAISSSGVPEAIWDYWQYFEAAATYGPPACVETTRKLTHIVDNILIGQAGTDYVGQLKAAFGLPNVTHDNDFASAINGGIYGLQSLNWDPTQSSDSFFVYCSKVSSDSVLFPGTEERRASIEELIKVGGYEDELDTLANRFLNYIGYVNQTSVAGCSGSQDACFTTHDAGFYANDDITQTWRLWQYQVCTQWGYLQTGSGVPEDQLPLISRTIDVDYSALICRDAFNLTKPADVEYINRIGGFNISYPRLAFIDGEWDPWRAAGVHAIGLPERNSTTEEPYILIAKAVHHWDENGLFPNETTADLPPAPVADAQSQMATFVKEWVQDFTGKY